MNVTVVVYFVESEAKQLASHRNLSARCCAYVNFDSWKCPVKCVQFDMFSVTTSFVEIWLILKTLGTMTNVLLPALSFSVTLCFVWNTYFVRVCGLVCEKRYPFSCEMKWLGWLLQPLRHASLYASFLLQSSSRDLFLKMSLFLGTRSFINEKWRPAPSSRTANLKDEVICCRGFLSIVFHSANSQVNSSCC